MPVALSLAALLATPAGAELVVLALRPLLGDEMVSANPDWGPPALSQPATWCAAALGLGWIAGLLARRRRPTPSELGPVLLALPFACTQSRALPLLAVLLAPLAARAAARETPEPSRAALAVPALFVLALGVVAVARPQPPLEAGFFPERTVACLREARPQGGRLLAVYHWGGYSIDRLWPAWRPFIDGRADAYPRDVHADYQAIAEAAPDALRRLEARGVDAVLWPTEGWSALPLALERAGWQAICRDDVGTAWAP